MLTDTQKVLRYACASLAALSALPLVAGCQHNQAASTPATAPKPMTPQAQQNLNAYLQSQPNMSPAQKAIITRSANGQPPAGSTH